jgi:hypothetical protein
MSSLCNGWGLGVETAEYWQWLGRNYRVFADLLDISETIIVGEHEIEDAIKMVTGDSILNPEMVLHHPGYYYLCAANCTRQKQAKISGREVYLHLTSDENMDDRKGDLELNAVMFENLSLSVEHFEKRGSRRTGAYVQLARCKSHYFAAKYDVALEYIMQWPLMQVTSTGNTDLSRRSVVRVTRGGFTTGIGLCQTSR